MNFLEVDDLDPARLEAVLDQAIAWKAEPDQVPAVLAGHGIAALFEKPSARTRNSTEMAVVQLGGHPVTLRNEEVGIDTRETAEDVARTLACYHAAICARVFDHTHLERMTAVVDIPVGRVVAMEFAQVTTSQEGEVVERVPADYLLPYVHQRYDDLSVLGKKG